MPPIHSRPPLRSAPPYAPALCGSTTYAVKKGDTLEGISATVVKERLTRSLTPFQFKALFGTPPDGASAAATPPAWTRNPTASKMWDSLRAQHRGDYVKTVDAFIKTNTFKELVLKPWLGTAAGYARVRAVQDLLAIKNDLPNPDLIRIGQQLNLLDERELTRALFTK